MALGAIYSRYSDNVGNTASARIESGTDLNDPDYAASVLFDGNPAQVAKIGSTSGAWEITTSSSPLTRVRIDYAALIHHDFMAGCDVKLQGSDAPNWAGSPVTAPEFEAAFTIPAWKGDGVTRYPVNAGLDLTGLPGYTSAGFFYWRLIITDNDQNIELGQLVLLSQIRRLDPHIRWEYVSEINDDLIENKTRKGISTIYSTFGPQRKLISQIRNDDDQDIEIDAHWYNVGGRAWPFLFVPFFPGQSSDDIDAYNEPMFVRLLDTKRAMTHFSWDVRDQPFLVEEVARGLRPGN